MSMDEFTRWNRPADGNRQFRSAPGAEDATAREQAEELIKMAIAQGSARSRREAIQGAMRTAQRAEVLARLRHEGRDSVPARAPALRHVPVQRPLPLGRRDLSVRDFTPV